MPLQVLQRPDWHGTPHELGELFILHKNRREAKAVIFTHQFGWEVRLLIGAQAEVVQTQVCRTQGEVLSTGEEWKGGDDGGVNRDLPSWIRRLDQARRQTLASTDPSGQ
jgi:hypothetical protein